MKRGDQHSVTVPSQVGESLEQSLGSTGETGVDMPSEKEIPDHAQTTSLGALPVDNPGSLKGASTWQTSSGDEAHIDISKELEEPADRKIVATGSGPDPEQMDDTF